MKGSSSKAAASEKARRMYVQYVEPLHDARTKLGAVSTFWKENWRMVRANPDLAELASEPESVKSE